MSVDPMLDGIQRYEPYEKFGCGGHSEGDFVLFSDLPALIARVRADERGNIFALSKRVEESQYAAGQRDEREACALAVEARGGYHSASEFAAAIRAREEKP